MKRSCFILFTLLSLAACNDKIETTYDYSYQHIATDSVDSVESWVFLQDFKPPLDLTNDSTFLNSINIILDHIGIDRLHYMVKHKKSFTQKRKDRKTYQWDDYNGTTLTLKRTKALDANGDWYDCVHEISRYH